MLNEWMEQKKISRYRLAKNSGIPYSTVNDICNGKTQLENVLPKQFTDWRKN